MKPSQKSQVARLPIGKRPRQCPSRSASFKLHHKNDRKINNEQTSIIIIKHKITYKEELDETVTVEATEAIIGVKSSVLCRVRGWSGQKSMN